MAEDRISVYAYKMTTPSSLQCPPFPTALTHLQELPKRTEDEVHSLRSPVGAMGLLVLRLSLPGWSSPVIEKSSESGKIEIHLL